MRGDLPFGTVTFLFTDIEGSTRLLKEAGDDRYSSLLAEHHRLCREVWAAHSGVEVDTAGDAFFVAFARASDALAAAYAAQAALGLGPLRVRMGLHTGEVSVNETGYVGLEVHRAARIAAAGHGGQVVVSSSTAALVATDGLRDLGDHRLKDLAAPERLYQLGSDEFPPLKSLYRTNLPVPATPFLGRERELAEVVELLLREDVRLLTLTGPGGTGKTRLALQAAADVSDRYPDGVTWVPLASLQDPSLLLSTVAQALHVSGWAGSLPGALAAGLAGRRMLILLDNMEHLLPQAALAVTTLASACEAGTLMVTSRERLQVQAETTWSVPPLSEADGERLFVERARATGVRVETDRAVAELCRRLDELPLALELAAARLVVFTPQQLLERLAERLDLLKGLRDVDPRQQTLRATIDWSYQLLAPDEQHVYRALSVFAGGCTLDGAEHVCRADPDLIQSLLNKSLLRSRTGRFGRRFWMLETIREHAAEQLVEHREAEEMIGRHTNWMLALLERLEPRPDVVLDPAPTEAVAADEIDDLRLAIPRLIERDPERAAAAAGVVGTIWSNANELNEGIEIVRAMYAATDDPSPRVVASAEGMLSWLTCLVGDFDAAQYHAQRAIEAATESESGYWLAQALQARALASHYVSTEDPAPFAEHALQSAQERKQPWEIVSALLTLGYISGLRADPDAARRYYERGAKLASEQGYPAAEANALGNLAEIALEQERYADAEVLAAKVLDADFHDPAYIGKAYACLAFAEALAGRRANHEAANLIAATDQEIERSGVFEDPRVTGLRNAALKRIEVAIGAEALATALQTGTGLPITEAIKLALRLGG